MKSNFFISLVFKKRRITNLDNFFLDAAFDVERESFLRSVGERDLESCFFGISGDAEREELLLLFDTALIGDSSSSDPSEDPEASEPLPGSLDADLELGACNFLDLMG